MTDAIAIFITLVFLLAILNFSLCNDIWKNTEDLKDRLKTLEAKLKEKDGK